MERYVKREGKAKQSRLYILSCFFSFYYSGNFRTRMPFGKTAQQDTIENIEYHDDEVE